MRKVFNEELLRFAEKDNRVFLVIADIGYGAVEHFKEKFPDRFINCGVAEQNMTGVACGIALEGNIAVTYTIANFVTLRCFEQIRNDICYSNANVKIIGVGAGVAYGELGVSHHSTEDIAIMRSLPNMVVIAPCDIPEARASICKIMEYKGPVYYRCGYKNEKDVHQGKIDFEIGKAITVKEGNDATIIFTGTIGYNAKIAAENLYKEGINIRVISMHTIKPIDKETIIQAAKKTKKIITIEEHNLSGGLGSAVAEVLADEGILGAIKFKRIGFPDIYITKVGNQEWIREEYGLGIKSIETEIRKILD